MEVCAQQKHHEKDRVERKAHQGGPVLTEANRIYVIPAGADPNGLRTNKLQRLMAGTPSPRRTTLRTIELRKAVLRRTALGRTMLSKAH